MSSHFRLSPLAAALLVCCVSCEEYDPPPEANLIQPEGGAYSEGDTIEIEFTEPVVEESLRFQVWPNERDPENEIVDGTKPLVDECGADETCGDLTIELVDGGSKAHLILEGELGTPGRPLLIELLPGLRDAAGNDTGVASTWDIQFKAATGVNTEPVEFDDGTYILVAQVNEPIPTVLTLMSHLKVLEDGRFALAGAEGDEINGDAKNTRNPENLVVDETSQGWVAHAVGYVTLAEDGKRLMETDPFDLVLPVGHLVVELEQVRVFADIVKNPDTGKDRLDGTLAFESLTLRNGDQSNNQPGGSTALIADFVPPEIEPEGIPKLCENLCGIVVEGYCEPPEDFPEPAFCETE